MPAPEFSVSVVIPAYNESPRIGRALDSVLQQTWPVDEIIVVDDGSTDGTSDVVARYGDSITCIRQDNQGLAAARNAGIRRARCAWIALLDADDEWLPDHIEQAWNQLHSHPEIMWYCAAFERRTEEGVWLPYGRLDSTLARDGIIENYFIAEARSRFSCASSMVVRRSVFAQVGLFNPDISKHGEDLDMWFRIALRYPRLAYSASVGCIYWTRQGSITSAGTTDLGRYLRRIEITRSAAHEWAGGPTRASDYLVQRWIIDAIKQAIRQKDVQTLGEIGDRYHAMLPSRWRFMVWLLRRATTMHLAQLALRLRARRGVP